MKKLLFIIILLLLSPIALGTDYTITSGTSTFDGDTDCSGTCTSSDRILIDSGSRGVLTIQDVNGSGSYIPIMNVGSGSKSSISPNLVIDNCSWVDIRGNNNPSHTFGIYIENVAFHSALYIKGTSDHIKISYIEITQSGSDQDNVGIKVQDATLSNTDIFDTFEIFNNYIHDMDCRCNGMYLGSETNPFSTDDPWLKDFQIYNNIFVNLGSYAITLKGVHSTSGDCIIKNNYFSNIGASESTESARNGIGVAWFDSPTRAISYHNYIANTYGPAYKIAEGNHLIFSNINVGNGAAGDSQYGQGIYADDVNVYYNGVVNAWNNVVIEPNRYGFYGHTATTVIHMVNNAIGEAGIGEWSGSGLVEGTGNQANNYQADVDTFGFSVWSDDSDYSNDEFWPASISSTQLVGAGAGLSPNFLGK